jgi:hypothetical protein
MKNVKVEHLKNSKLGKLNFFLIEFLNFRQCGCLIFKLLNNSIIEHQHSGCAKVEKLKNSKIKPLDKNKEKVYNIGLWS